MIDGYARSAERFGADEQVECVALLDFEGRLDEVGFILRRYGDAWRNGEQVGCLAALLTWGAPRPTTIKWWDELTTE